MAYAINEIDIHPFIALNGEVDLPRSESQVIVRPNVEHLMVRLFQRKGRPFDLESVVDVTSYAGGVETFNAYTTLIDTDPIILVKNSLNYWIIHDLRAKVLDVRLVRISPILQAVGNLMSSNPSALLRCAWTIVMVP